MFSYEFYEIFENSFFTVQLWLLLNIFFYVLKNTLLQTYFEKSVFSVSLIKQFVCTEARISLSLVFYKTFVWKGVYKIQRKTLVLKLFFEEKWQSSACELTKESTNLRKHKAKLGDDWVTVHYAKLQISSWKDYAEDLWSSTSGWFCKKISYSCFEKSLERL